MEKSSPGKISLSKQSLCPAKKRGEMAQDTVWKKNLYLNEVAATSNLHCVSLSHTHTCSLTTISLPIEGPDSGS